MANICVNIASFCFQGNEETFEERIKEFDEWSRENIDWFFDSYYIDEGAGIIEANFESKWNTPEEQLQECANKFNVNIIGCSWDFGNNYVNSFEIYPELND